MDCPWGNIGLLLVYNPSLIKQWDGNKTTEFSNLILKYTQENIYIYIYIKDPFAVKYLIDENASR